MTSKSFKVFLYIDLLVVIFCVLLGRFDWLLNTQVAFISSLLVTIGSYLGYKKNIQARVQNHPNLNKENDDYDELDQMDDQFDLYSLDIKQDEPKELSVNEIKEEIKKNKKAIKKDNFKNFQRSFTAMTSLYRVAGYVFLVVGFFYLNNNGYLDVVPYILGFLIVPISALVLQVVLKKQIDTNKIDKNKSNLNS